MFAPGVVLHGRPRSLTRTDFVRYAGISGDLNPLHHDEVAARAAGEPSVFGHGMFSAALLASALTDVVGVDGLRRFTVRFTRQVRPGEVVVPELTVRSVVAVGTVQRVIFECVLRADAGDVVRGSAEAEVPA